MDNYSGFRIIPLAVLATFFLFSCKNPVSKEKTDTLFRMVDTKYSGISFGNQLHETDTSNSIFYEYYYNGAGLAVGDLNNDGLSDIFFGANMSKCRLYLNKGDLKFEDITEKCGIDTKGKWITGVSFADINQDGWPDIYLCAAGNLKDDYHNLLYISNGDKNNLEFSEKAAVVGLNDNGYSTQAEFFDYDKDGDLDVYIVTAAMNIPNKNAIRPRKNDGSMPNTDRLYRNDGINPATGLPVFNNVSKEAGITWDGFGLGAAVCDINKDGWPDIYVGNDYISNDLLYVNQCNGTFSEMSNQYFKHTSNSTMGVDIADFNNDGLIDIFTLDMQPEDYFRKRIMAGNMHDYKRYMEELQAGYSHQYVRNMLQLNQGLIEGQFRFSEIGQLAGIFETDWSWAPLSGDFDNDGFRDLFIGNGIRHDMTNMDFSVFWMTTVKKNLKMPWNELYKLLINELNKKGDVKKPNVIFKNSGGLTFENKTAEWGLDEPLYSTSSAFTDLDNDGDLDLVLNNINDPASVYENTTIKGGVVSGNFLEIILSGDSLNKGGIGTKINLYYGNKQQYYEHYPIRGFQSMVDPKIHFGLGEVSIVDSLMVTWPDGKGEMLYELKSNQILTLTNLTAQRLSRQPEKPKRKIFTSAKGKLNIDYVHAERQFIDFDIQPLVPHKYSQEGPGIAVGDINSDELDDFFIGGSTGYSGKIFIQQKSGEFTSSPLPGNNNYEDMGSLLFDADGDGDNDLYVVSGGSGLPPGNQFYADRLYINNGKGSFTINNNALPDSRVCGSQVTASDFDKDGDLDLFVCGRVDLEKYPSPPRSFLLRNDSKGNNVQFTDITQTVCPDLERPGLVAAALWTDFDNDGLSDLILAGEWMPLSFFKNDNGKFINITAGTGIEKYSGWWNSICAADFDQDGDIDYVAGNLGLNSQYKVSQEEPMRIIAKDFDMNGTIDPVCTYYVQGKSYPIYHRNLLLSQIPSLQNRFKSYGDYATATFNDIFPESSLKGAYIKDSRFFQSAYIENTGKGTFRMSALPVEAQISPVFGMLADDYNSDGNTDLILNGNSYSSNIYTGRYDAFTGLLLTGDGKGGFSTVPGPESGFFADGDAKSLASLTAVNGNSIILAAQNSDSLKVYQTAYKPERILRLKNDEVSAIMTLKNGESRHLEFYYGSGYLSQSSRIINVPPDAVSISISNYKGKTRKLTF